MFGQSYSFLIIEKNQADIDTIKSLLSDIIPEGCVVHSAGSIEDALKTLTHLFVDLIFIDINIAQKRGFELINYFSPELRPTIVFISEPDEFQVDLINARIFYYLFKPFKKEQVAALLSRFMNEVLYKDEKKMIRYFLDNFDSVYGANARIALPNKEHLDLVCMSRIVRCESKSNYTHIYTIDGLKYVVPKTLKEVEKLLSDSFFRIHRSHVINLNLCKKINGKHLSVEMMNGHLIPISEDRKSNLMGKVKIAFNQKNGALITNFGEN